MPLLFFALFLSFNFTSAWHLLPHRMGLRGHHGAMSGHGLQLSSRGDLNMGLAYRTLKQGGGGPEQVPAECSTLELAIEKRKDAMMKRVQERAKQGDAATESRAEKEARESRIIRCEEDMKKRVEEAERIAQEEAKRLAAVNLAKVLPFRLAAVNALKQAATEGFFLPVGQYEYLPPYDSDGIEEANLEFEEAAPQHQGGHQGQGTLARADPGGKHYWNKVLSALWYVFLGAVGVALLVILRPSLEALAR